MTAPVSTVFVKEPYGFMGKAQQLVLNYIRTRLAIHNIDHEIDIDGVQVFWFKKDRRNWEAHLSTTLPDSVYYRVVHDARQGETRLDVYHKFDTQTTPDKEAY
jgi:hypothetical protein